MSANASVRYFAGIAQRIGKNEETFDGLDSITDLFDQIVAAHGASIEPSLSACSFLVDGKVVTDKAAPLGGSLTIDVLPPFAGG